MESLINRTEKAIGCELISKIAATRFCVVGCGGVGAVFAEMLVRSGAMHIQLIDGDKIEESNLNRVFAFTQKDIGKFKITALSEKLVSINPSLSIKSIDHHIKALDEDCKGNQARDMVCNANCVIIACDTFESRGICTELCEWNRLDYLSVGVQFEENGDSRYECIWKPKHPKECRSNGVEGYGNGSYISIVTEATSVGFNMLLNHLKNPKSDFKYFKQSYSSFKPSDKPSFIPPVSTSALTS